MIERDPGLDDHFRSYDCVEIELCQCPLCIIYIFSDETFTNVP